MKFKMYEMGRTNHKKLINVKFYVKVYPEFGKVKKYFISQENLKKIIKNAYFDKTFEADVKKGYLINLKFNK